MTLWFKRGRRTSTSELQKQVKQFLQEQAKLNELHNAMRDVEQYEAQVRKLRTIHLHADEPKQWEDILNSPPPFEKGMIGPKEAEAQMNYANYRPTLWDRLFGRSKRAELEAKIIAAREEDRKAYETWREEIDLAAKVLQGSAAAYAKAIDTYKPFADLAEFGSEFSCRTDGAPKRVEVEFRVHSDKIIPKVSKSLTKTGKLSVSNMPVTGYYGLMQDYVCGTIIRIARDLFALLPLEEVIIHAEDVQMNEAVGRPELITIVSVRIEKNVLDLLNMEAIDPSEALKNFEHRMNFLKTKGFRPVERLIVR